MQMTISLSPEATKWVTERATVLRQDASEYAAWLIDRAAGTVPSLDEVLAPVRQAFAESGMTDHGLGDMLEEAKHAARAERSRAAPSHG